MMVTFRGRREGNRVFGGPNSTWRKGPERFYFEVQISWQGQHFGHGGDLRRALISCHGAANCDVSTRGRISEVVAGGVLCGP